MKAASLPRRTLHLEPSIVELDDLARNGQAEAAAPFRAITALARTVEPLEDVGQIGGVDSTSGIRHGRPHGR